MSTPANSLSGSINLNTGLLQVRIGDADGNSAAKGYGALLQNANFAGGFFVIRDQRQSIFLNGSGQPHSFQQTSEELTPALTPAEQALAMAAYSALHVGARVTFHRQCHCHRHWLDSEAIQTIHLLCFLCLPCLLCQGNKSERGEGGSGFAVLLLFFGGAGAKLIAQPDQKSRAKANRQAHRHHNHSPKS